MKDSKSDRPHLDGLRKAIAKNRQSVSAGQSHASAFVRQTFCLPRDQARQTAREWFDRYPKAAYWTEVESWRMLEGDAIEFTMRRLSSAD